MHKFIAYFTFNTVTKLLCTFKTKIEHYNTKNTDHIAGEIVK